MKKLTSLQVMMLMSLALGSSQMHGGMQKSNMKDDSKAVMLELQVGQDEQAKVDVLTDLVATEPKSAERIILDEANLEANFTSIKNFVHKRNNEIERLNKKDVIAEPEVAIIAVELADAQAALDKTIAKQLAKHKHNHRLEQAVKDALKKAEQGLKSLQRKAMNSQSAVQEMPKKGKSVKKYKTEKPMKHKTEKAMPKKKSESKKKSKSKKNNDQVMMSEKSQA